jgi:proteasome lid subunit RPN8/RPN11
VLELSPLLQERLRAACERAYPAEACGLLIGRVVGSSRRVERIRVGRNLETRRARTRHELDPRDLVAADAEARDAGRELLGCWHSHPDRPAVPSEADRSAAWPGWSHVIVSVVEGRAGELRSWRPAGRLLREERVGSGAGAGGLPSPQPASTAPPARGEGR